MAASNVPVEIKFAALMVAAMLGFSVTFHLPIRLPASGGAEFIGVHYLLPLIGLLLWAGCAVRGGDRSRLASFAIALICYTLVLLAHFHLKLWAPIINPRNYDRLYWATDQQIRPLVDATLALHKAIVPIVPHAANFYMIGFILLFYASFCYHALRTPEVFRTLFLSVLFVQGLGAFGYLIMPAVGPFLFEQGLNPHITETQHYMLGVRQQMIAGGSEWLSANQHDVLLAGLGAMPSLHAGASIIFLWFAIRHGRILLPIYVPFFGYIAVTAIASRWHYLIDLPVGFALAGLSMALAHLCTRKVGAGTTRGEIVVAASFRI